MTNRSPLSAAKPLPASFYGRSTLAVARDLVGARVFVEVPTGRASGRVVEVEAYLGRDDPASHAAGGPTPRSAIMFGPAGVAYVYFIYGMHHCLNVVTESDGRAGAVLLRALEPLSGHDLMARRRFGQAGRRRPDRRSDLCNGPGKLCRALGVDLACNGLSLSGRGRADRRIWLEAAERRPRLVAAPRIGVRRAADRPYRFVDADSDCLSGPVPAS